MVNAFGINLGAWMSYKFTRIEKSHHNPNLRKGIPYNICYSFHHIYINVAKLGVTKMWESQLLSSYDYQTFKTS